MAAGPDSASSTGNSSSGCRARLFPNLNPLTLYDPRSRCSQGMFFWGLAYPAVAAFLVYSAIMVAALAIAAATHQEPSRLINRTAFASAISTTLAGARLILGPLIVLRRAKDLGWGRLIGLVWLLLTAISLQTAVPILNWVAGATQLLLLLLLLILPGKIARSGTARPS